MNDQISIDVDFISSIIGLSKQGVDQMAFFVGKERESGLVTCLKGKYNLTSDTRGFSIASIND